MKSVLLIPFETIENLLEKVKDELEEILQTEVSLYSGIPEIHPSRRGKQSLASDYIPIINRVREKEEADYGLGITKKDLFVPEMNFIFGLASSGNSSCIVSINRLEAEKEGIFLNRTIKECVHELGHLRGLKHCPHPDCVMHFSNTLADTDRKGKTYCERCRERL